MAHRKACSIVTEFFGNDLMHLNTKPLKNILDAVDHRRRAADDIEPVGSGLNVEQLRQYRLVETANWPIPEGWRLRQHKMQVEPQILHHIIELGSI